MYAVFLMESVRCVHCFLVNFHFASFSVCRPIGQDMLRPLNVTTEVVTTFVESKMQAELKLTRVVLIC